MTRGRRRLLALACAAALLVTGCAFPGTGGSEPPNADQRSGRTVAYSCVWGGSDGGKVFLGETISVSRGPEGPCEGLELGSTQTFLFHSGYLEYQVSTEVEVDVAEDGSFAFEVPVPATAAIGSAYIEPVPADPECDVEGALDCPPPRVYLEVGHPPSSLGNVTIVSTEQVTAGVPSGVDGDPGYALRGPTEDRLTVVIFGPGCPAVPKHFVATAARDSLELVSHVEAEACNEPRIPWSSVIEVPDGYDDFTTAKVDNVPVRLMAATG